MAAKQKTRYEILPCGEDDARFIWEKGFEDLPAFEGSGEERLVFKAADAEGCIVGGCVLDIDETAAAEFERLWVDERFRRRGVGAALISEAERNARERGCRVAVNAYCFDFQNARPLFEKLGYRLIGIAKDWPRGHEGYTLIKKLDTPSDAGAAESFKDCGLDILPGSEEDGELIAQRLEDNNLAFAPRSHEYIDIDKKLVDENGDMLAGCVAGVSGWDTLHIDVFWADKAGRDKDFGAYLLAEIEREAKDIGAYLAEASVPEAQAAFFKEQGYEVCVAFEDEPGWRVLYKRL